MTKRQLLKKLRDLQNDKDCEIGHLKADKLLLEYIDDPLIKKEFTKIERYYA